MTMMNATERLRFVLKEVKDAAGMETARKMAKEITDASDESSKDLEVRITCWEVFGLKFRPLKTKWEST